MASPENGECKPEKMSQLFLRDKAISIDQSFSFSCHSQRRSIDVLSEKCHYNGMDPSLQVHLQKIAGARRLQKSFDSQEFEFDMSTTAPHVREPEQVAPADELFYKGQLLPLQHDPRHQLVQTLSSRIITNQQDRGERSQRVFSCVLGEQDMKFGSCRSDVVGLENGLTDSGCSSFRSQNSSFWEKEAGDSSSSRDSNGSSQDSCYSAEKETSINAATGKSHCGKSQGRSGTRTAFSWKSIVHNLTKAPKSWVDDRVEGQKSTGRDMDQDGKQKPQLFHSNLTTSLQSKEAAKTSSIRVQSDYNSVSTSSGKWTGPVEREKDRTSWHSKGRWRRYVKKLKPLYVKMTQKYEERGIFGQLRMEDCGGASVLNDTIAFTKSPLERKLSHSALCRNADRAFSSRFLTVASCPTSMRSSPNHSGVLAVIDKGSSISTMQELQSAVQSAIAHCKQSQAGKPVDVNADMAKG